jgi:uncharacterized glyoxalase superfamily protein PhnB
MKATGISPCVVTSKLNEVKYFYTTYFDAQITFDSGWYLILTMGDEAVQLEFMEKRRSDQPVAEGAGIVYRLAVEDVDAEYARLTEAGISPCMPLEQRPMGDRGFGVRDPIGILVYIYTLGMPNPEFFQYFK